MNDNKSKWCCIKCKGTDLHIQAWIHVNTGEYIEDLPYREGSIWCEDCQDHTRLGLIPVQKELNFEEDKKCP